jgi:hypothetical protein
MADTVTISTTTNSVTVTPSGGTSVSLSSPVVNTVTIGLGVGVVNLAGQTSDDLSEGSGNLYYTTARASADAPIQSVSASTGINTTTSAGGAVSITNTKLGTVTGVTMPSGYTVSDSSGALTVAYNNVAAIRTDLGLVPGTAANELVQLTSEGKLPAVNGSLLTNLASAPTLGISNTNSVKIDSASVASGEYAKFTASGLESRSTAEVLTDIGAAAASHNQALSTITGTGGAAALNVGTVAGTVAAGDDARLSDARTPSSTLDHDASKITTGTLVVGRGGTGLTSISTLLNSNTTKSDVGLSAVENTAVSTWAGSESITTTGTVGTGVWNATAILDTKIDLRVDHGVTFDGGGSVIESGKVVYVPVERAGVIKAATLVADASGAITITITRYDPDADATTLGGSAAVGSIALATKIINRDTTLSGWTLAVAEGDVLAFTTGGTIATVTRVTCKLKVELA